jgi:hypothetical protein
MQLIDETQDRNLAERVSQLLQRSVKMAMSARQFWGRESADFSPNTASQNFTFLHVKMRSFRTLFADTRLLAFIQHRSIS